MRHLCTKNRLLRLFVLFIYIAGFSGFSSVHLFHDLFHLIHNSIHSHDVHHHTHDNSAVHLKHETDLKNPHEHHNVPATHEHHHNPLIDHLLTAIEQEPATQHSHEVVSSEISLHLKLPVTGNTERNSSGQRIIKLLPSDFLPLCSLSPPTPPPETDLSFYRQ